MQTLDFILMCEINKIMIFKLIDTEFNLRRKNRYATN